MMIAIYYKYGLEKHLEDLKNGILYCNSLEYFQNLEIDRERQDPHEGNIISVPPNEIEMKLIYYKNGEKKVFIFPSDEMTKSVEIRKGDSPSHIFCCSHEILEYNKPYKIKDYFNSEKVVIFDNNFIKGIANSLKEANIHFECRLVEYVDYNPENFFEKKWNQKHIKYQHQREYRFAIWGQPKDKPFIHKFEPQGAVETSYGLEATIKLERRQIPTSLGSGLK